MLQHLQLYHKTYSTMKTKILTPLAIMAMLMAGALLSGFNFPQDKWIVPDEYKNMENEYAGEDEDGIGEELYEQHCKSCHGEEGHGDGTKAKELETPLRDLTSEEVQSQTDGELYYKAIIGRDEMPNFEKKIRDEEDRWMLINYLRALAK